VSERLGQPLDQLRKKILGRPDLQKLFTRVGPTRVIPADRLDDLKAALANPPAN
jgi:hypothetical protein